MEKNLIYYTLNKKKKEKQKKTINAQDLWNIILESQMETGTPYMLYKDSVNKKSNQKNLGIIRSSNLCTEIMQYSSKDETAVCNLASISLPAYAKDNDIDHELLHNTVMFIVGNMDLIVENNC